MYWISLKVVTRPSRSWRSNSLFTTTYRTVPISENTTSAAAANMVTSRVMMECLMVHQSWCINVVAVRGYIASARFQHVTHAANGMKQLVAERRIDLGAQALDGDFDDIGIAVEIHVPNQFGNCRLGQNFTLTPRHDGQ